MTFVIATRAGVRRVDGDGIALWGLGDRAIDVLFDGRRVWSFWLERDTRTTVPGVWSVGWPGALTKFLDGQTRLTVTEHVTGRVLFDQELSFGTATRRIEIVGRSGAPISLDKSGRISPTFDTRSAADVEPLLNAIRTVLDAIASAGIEAFLAYGTLLGAVREKRFLGHDSDADLAYVSEYSNPCDVVRESFRLQRAVHERGFRTYRYSGAAFRIDVVEGDGVVRGLDVFAGFLDGSGEDCRLYQMGEIGSDVPARVGLPVDDVHPRGPHLPGASRAGTLARGGVRAVLGGPGPRLQVHAFRPHGPPADRLVPRYVGQPVRLGAHLQRQPRQAADHQAVRGCAQGRQAPRRRRHRDRRRAGPRRRQPLAGAGGPERARLRLRAERCRSSPRRRCR